MQVLALLALAASRDANPFGIGAYFPPGGEQISLAADLVGKGGWVLILVPCGNVTSETVLPPAHGSFDPAAQMTDAFARGMNVVVRLEPQYSAYQPFTANSDAWVLPDGSPDCHMNSDCHLRRLQDQGSNHTSYKTVASSYAKVAAIACQDHQIAVNSLYKLEMNSTWLGTANVRRIMCV
jgi:hypothetical protein